MDGIKIIKKQLIEYNDFLDNIRDNKDDIKLNLLKVHNILCYLIHLYYEYFPKSETPFEEINEYIKIDDVKLYWKQILNEEKIIENIRETSNSYYICGGLTKEEITEIIRRTPEYISSRFIMNKYVIQLIQLYITELLWYINNRL